MTGLSQEQLDLLIDRVADQVGSWQPPRGRHRTLDLATTITMTLVWLRHNLSQALLGAFHGISQPTVSRIIGRLRELIAGAATQGMPGLAETEAGERLLLDGSLLPTGNRAGQQGQGLYSGKRHQAGMNVQVIGDGWGRLLDVSDPTPGSMHDARSFATGLAALLPAGPCWPILALWGVGCRRRCVNPLVGSCASWRRSPTAPMPAFARWWSGPSRCSSSGRYWGWGIVGRWPGSQG